MSNSRIKIIATIGPASSGEQNLTAMVKAGLDLIRLNFSHGDFAEHEPKVILARKIARELNQSLEIIQDLAGPKIRLGDLSSGSLVLETGKFIVLTPEIVQGTAERLTINFPSLAQEIKVGQVIKLDDGKEELRVVEIKGAEIKCQIVVGGKIQGRRSVNLPGLDLPISALTEKDKNDLEFAFRHQLEWVALSFVRRAADILELRQLLQARNSTAKIIAKIETQTALVNLDEIIAVADGIMVARGDLAVEISAEEVPLKQKEIIKKCNAAGKMVIVATQMLESMVNSLTPTRAEVSDVANAVLDGADALMLSDETAFGQHPVEAVQEMEKIIKIL